MFKKARWRLTFSYAVVIMAISLFFSAVAYQRVGFEFRARLGVIERRLQSNVRPLQPPPGETMFFVRDLSEVKQRILWALLILNGVILVISLGSGYWLSGLTLKPIEQAMAEQKRFVADASHELRTPLTALNTALEVALRSRQLSLKEAKKILSQVHGDTQDLIKLSNDLLLLSRGNNHTQFKAVNLKKVVQAVAVKIRPLLNKKKIKLAVKTEAVKVDGEEESLQKLLLILLDNAVKYSNTNGLVEVSVKQANGRAEIKVKDNGMGISSKDLPHIFKRFYRAEASRSKTKVAGFGLGLAIAQKIVSSHQGTIKAESLTGKGTTMTVSLPLQG